MHFHDLSIWVDDKGNTRGSSVQGEHRGKIRLDINSIELASQLIEDDRTDEALLKSVGRTLFNALFDAEMLKLYIKTINASSKKDHCVRLRLTFEDPELTVLPWELLYDDTRDTFLAKDPRIALSRYIPVPLKKLDVKPARLPLKMLLVISSPKDMTALNLGSDERLIRRSLEKLVQSRLITIDVVTKATIKEIDQKLNEKPYNIFRFIGHGVVKNNKGHVALMDDNDKAHLLDDQSFANLFLGKRGLALVILNVSEGASRPSSEVFVGMAPNLVKRGVPAVITMHYPIKDETSKLFTEKFYHEITHGQPVDVAMQISRKHVSKLVGQNKRDFVTPILFMRAADGVILDLATRGGKLAVEKFKHTWKKGRIIALLVIVIAVAVALSLLGNILKGSDDVPSIALDSTGDVGEFTSLAIDSNDKVHISYYDATSRDLGYITNADEGWHAYRHDSTGDVGEYTSLAIDSNDKVHISYYDRTNGNLKYATNVKGSWSTEILDSGGDVGEFTSLAIDSNDKVHISYYDATSRDLGYITNADEGWHAYRHDSTGDVGEYTSLAIDSNDKVHISYYDRTNGNLKYATNVKGSWSTATVDAGGDVGEFTSIALDSNDKVHISYYDRTNGNLKYATNAKGSWSTSIVDSDGDVGEYTSIALDTNDKVHISYYDRTNGRLKYYTTSSDSYDGGPIYWPLKGNVGQYTSIALDSEHHVYISYYNLTSEDLNYITNVDGDWYFYKPETAGNVGKHSSIIKSSENMIHISYYDGSRGDLMYLSIGG